MADAQRLPCPRCDSAGGMTMDLFPDTNFFLHFRHAAEVRWEDVTAADTISLVVGRAVAKELDKKKHDLRGRPQDRAREYTMKLGRIATSGSPETLREAGPRVTLDVLAGRPAEWECPKDLDGSWGDDVLIADALGFRHEHPGADIAILTGDPGLMAKARSHGIGILALTETDWQLPPENTSEEKELARLRKENEELKRLGPVIGHQVLVAGGETSAIQLVVTSCAPLDEATVSEILTDLKARHPERHEARTDGAPVSLRPGGTVLEMDAEPYPVEWTAPTEDAIGRYRAAYRDWLREAERFVRDFRIDDEPPVTVDMAIEVRNSGTRPAEHARLELEALGGPILVKAPEADAEPPPPSQARERLRRPPSPPQWGRSVKRPAAGAGFDISTLAGLGEQLRGFEGIAHLNDRLAWLSPVAGLPEHLRLLEQATSNPALRAALEVPDGFSRMASELERLRSWNADDAAIHNLKLEPFIPQVPKPRDRHRFYREFTPEAQRTVRWDFSCEEFRHRTELFTARLRLCLPAGFRPPGNAAVRIRLSASNMREPFVATVPVRIAQVELDLRKMIEEHLP